MGGMQQPPQFNWRCVTLNKWCKNKRWLEAWGRGPGDAACFIGQELCTAPGWNWAVHCWDALQPPNHQASQWLLCRKRQRDESTPQKCILPVLWRRCGWSQGPDWSWLYSSNKDQIIILICNLNFCTPAIKSITVKSRAWLTHFWIAWMSIYV